MHCQMKQATEDKPDQQGDSEYQELRPFTLSANSVEPRMRDGYASPEHRLKLSKVRWAWPFPRSVSESRVSSVLALPTGESLRAVAHVTFLP
jgi:hypothetical protein